MERLDQTSIRALRSLLDSQPTTDAKVGFAWRIAAGPTLARAGTLTWSENGTLVIVARSEDWRRATPILTERVNQLLGPGVVRRIKVAASSAADRRA
jgi:Dna[CI] antecedent, DciA